MKNTDATEIYNVNTYSDTGFGRNSKIFIFKDP
jgi:hypothetical protein